MADVHHHPLRTDTSSPTTTDVPVEVTPPSNVFPLRPAGSDA